MINGLLSSQNAVIEPILARNKVPQIDYSDAPPTWGYTINVPHGKHSEMQLRFAADKLHAKTIALLYSQTTYGQLGVKEVVAQAQALGLKIVQQVGVEPTLTDLTPLMASVKDAKPDAVVDILTGATDIVEAKAATTVGLKVPLIMVADDVVTLQKVAAEYPNIYFTVQPPQAYPSVPNPQLRASIASFLSAYRAANLDPAGLLGAASGWDAVTMLEEGVKQAGGNTGGDSLNSGFQKVAFNGCNSVFRFSASDNTGQAAVPNPIQVANIKGSTVNVVFSAH
jgi:ABC-type branched-subunit amino acid transport system substrate-binding protein